MRRVQQARHGVLRDARAGRPLLLRAALPARAVPLAAAHLLHWAASLPPARARLRSVHAPARLLLPPPARAALEEHPVGVIAARRGRGRRVAAAALHAAVRGVLVSDGAARAPRPGRGRACARVNTAPRRARSARTALRRAGQGGLRLFPNAATMFGTGHRTPTVGYLPEHYKLVDRYTRYPAAKHI